MLKGIDVSTHQGNIDWNKVKSNIDFAILRCGYGNDIEKQDDAQFVRNVSECKRLGIPYGVYLYSYANTVQKLNSEIAHTLRLISGLNPFCVYFDMEDNSTTSLGKATLTEYAKEFCEAIKTKGFKVGIYANQNWFQNYLDVAALYNAGYSIWCAKYSDNKPNIAASYDIWQYSSKGSIAGISGNVDMNYMYKDIRNITKNASTKKTISKIAQEVIAGKWGNGTDRKTKLEAAGYNYSKVQSKVNELLKTTTKKTNKEIAKEVVQGKWGNGTARKKKLADAGYDYDAIQKLVNKMM